MKRLIKLEPGNYVFKVNGIIRLNVREAETSVVHDEAATCEYEELPVIFRSTRYTCTCDPDVMGDCKKRFATQVVVELPAQSKDRARRLKDGLSATVCIDPCIVEVIKDLWTQGIETTGCCCGHNVMRGWVSVQASNYERMFELGYRQRPVEYPAPGVAHGLYTFFL